MLKAADRGLVNGVAECGNCFGFISDVTNVCS